MTITLTRQRFPFTTLMTCTGRFAMSGGLVPRAQSNASLMRLKSSLALVRVATAIRESSVTPSGATKRIGSTMHTGALSFSSCSSRSGLVTPFRRRIPHALSPGICKTNPQILISFGTIYFKLAYRWLRHRLKNYNEQNFIIIAILIMIAAHLSFLLLLSFLFLLLSWRGRRARGGAGWLDREGSRCTDDQRCRKPLHPCLPVGQLRSGAELRTQLLLHGASCSSAGWTGCLMMRSATTYSPCRSAASRSVGADR